MEYADRWTTVRVEIDEGIAWVELNRPEKRSAMSPTVNAEMVEVLQSLDADDACGVLVLTGAGEAFSAGMDMKEYLLPALPGALELAGTGVRTGGDARNRDFAGPALTSDGATDAQLTVAFDPQTAGGVLVSLPAKRRRARGRSHEAWTVPSADRLGHAGRRASAQRVASRSRRGGNDVGPSDSLCSVVTRSHWPLTFHATRRNLFGATIRPPPAR